MRNYKDINKIGAAQKISGFTMVELMIVVTIIGILAATAGGSFRVYILRSKTTEAVQALQKLAAGEAVYYVKNARFLSAGPINIPPSLNRVTSDFSLDPNWGELSFSYSDSIQFGYQATATAPGAVDCIAMGDLNGNGDTSLFRISMTAPPVSQSQVMIFDEIE